MIDPSLFHFYSAGVAAENLNLTTGTWYLEVFPTEKISYVDGEINADQHIEVIKGVDAFGKAYQVEVVSSNALKALWLPMSSNQTTPPNMRRGMRLFIYRYADTDQYFWTDQGRDQHLKCLETVTFAFSNVREPVKVRTPDNSWIIEVSTHFKRLHIQTNKSDGEAFAYNLTIDAKEGFVQIGDDADNFFLLDSKEAEIGMRNTDGSLLSLVKTKGLFQTKDSITLETKDIIAKAKTITFTADSFQGNYKTAATVATTQISMTVGGQSVTIIPSQVGVLGVLSINGA